MPVRCGAALFLCTSVATHKCVVCGCYFCPQHGDTEGPHCRRCKRDYTRKLDAEEAERSEVSRRGMAMQQNSDGLCGWTGCDEPMLVHCRHCGLLYCGRHSNISHYSYRYRSRKGVESRRATITLCDACKPRLREYRKEKTWLDV